MLLLTDDEKQPISSAVSDALKSHFAQLDTKEPHNLYRQIVDAAEKELLEDVMKRTSGNQSKAAIWLGINRATLRAKLKRHGLM